MLILLPPSEGKAAPRRGKPARPRPAVASPGSPQPRERGARRAGRLCAGRPEHAARMLGLGPTQADDVRRNARLLAAPTARADAIYTGVLYEALDLALARRGSPASRVALARGHLVAVRAGAPGRPDPVVPTRRRRQPPRPRRRSPRTGARASTRSSREAAGTGLVVDLRSTPTPRSGGPAADLARAGGHRARAARGRRSRRRWSATSTRPPRAGWCARCSRTAATPRTPARLADAVADLGWKVELGDPGRHGQQLDVSSTRSERARLRPKISVGRAL